MTTNPRPVPVPLYNHDNKPATGAGKSVRNWNNRANLNIFLVRTYTWIYGSWKVNYEQLVPTHALASIQTRPEGPLLVDVCTLIRSVPLPNGNKYVSIRVEVPLQEFVFG
uniref:Uncharacterized protein n=1 Tax=Oryza barthii TaxID=65489 RepID=A0A0D3GEN2_9ORYZ